MRITSFDYCSKKFVQATDWRVCNGELVLMVDDSISGAPARFQLTWPSIVQLKESLRAAGTGQQQEVIAEDLAVTPLSPEFAAHSIHLEWHYRGKVANMVLKLYQDDELQGELLWQLHFDATALRQLSGFVKEYWDRHRRSDESEPLKFGL